LRFLRGQWSKWARFSSILTGLMKLRGSSTARVDDKGRLKIPSEFVQGLKEYGTAFYITSPNGESARIYPLKVWSEIEDRLATTPNSKEKRKFLMNTSYFGQMTELDGQGRVLLPAILREKALLSGDVAVLALPSLNYLEIVNNARIVDQMKNEPFTDAEEDALGL